MALGQVARRRGDGVAAIQNFRSASEANPDNLDLKLDLAAELREQGYFDEAIALIRAVLDADADHWTAWMQLGLYHRANGDLQSALEAFRTAVTKQPKQTQGLVDLALENWFVGDLAEAEKLLQCALEQEPTHLAALIVSAENALRTEQPDKAFQIAQRAIELHPGQLAPYLVAARAAANNVECEVAFGLLDQARVIFGLLPEIAATQIHILRQYRDHNALRSLLANSSEQAGRSFSFWIESTSFAITVGDFDTAERALISAPAKSTREFARVNFLRAHIAEGRRQYRQAIASYKEALALEPRNGGWHSEMARACLLLADIDGVRSNLQAAFNFDAATKIAAGQSLNISQHHTGQLLDEFAMDPELLAELKHSYALPAEARIKKLTQLVRDNSDHTAPALLLLLAMRQAGSFSIDGRQAPQEAIPQIPQQIVQFWNTEVPPPDISDLIASWRTSHDDFEHRLFNDESADQYLGEFFSREVRQAFRRAEQPAQRADIFRLACLALEGGYYVDVDDLCLARIDTFVPAYVKMFCYQENYATIANNFIGAAPRHPVIVRALRLAVDAVNRGDRDVVWLSTGPGLLTRAFAQIVAEKPSSDWLNETIVLELWEAHRLIGIHCPAVYKNTDQHWSRAVFRRQPTNSSSSSFVATVLKSR